MSDDDPTLDELEAWLAGDLAREQAEALARRVTQDSALAARVERLKEQLALGDELRAVLAQESAPDASGEAPADIPQLDDYDVLGEIARGGQGVVLRARQRSTGRDVALKVVLPSQAGHSHDQQRFEREVDLAASLSHPHVVKVFDRGATRDGRAFVVMELVDGRPIDLAATKSGLELAARLELFDRLCAAIAYAHRHGVIHRDLKPANVLVDAELQPHVLDFGLAKQHGDAAVTELTAPGAFIGTLPFAAPEQLQGDGDADARADVYGLGVILYRMLTGEHPYALDGSLGSVVRNVLEVEPTAPSRVTRSAGGPPLDDDLDALVLTCMAKRPDDRYATVEALRDDIGRWTRGEPLIARSDRRGYVLRKTIRRYRLPLSALGVVLVALVAAIVVSTNALDDMRQQATRANDLNDFMVESLGEARPGWNRSDVTIMEWMREAAAHIDGRFPDAPLSEASIRDAVARVLRSAGDWQEAEQHAAAAVAVFDEHLGPRSPESLSARSVLAECAHFRGDLELATERFESLLPVAREVLGPASGAYAEVIRSFAYMLATARRGEVIVDELREVLDLQLATAAADSRIVPATRNALATVLRSLYEHDEALAIWDGLVDTYTARHGPQHGLTLGARYDRANVLVDLGRVDEALDDLESVLADQHDRLAPENPDLLQTRVAYAGVLMRLRRRDEALTELLEIVPLCQDHLGERNSVTLQALHGLGALLRVLGQARDALTILEQALAGRLEVLGPDHEYTLLTSIEVGVAARALGQHDRAEQVLRDAVERSDSLYGEPERNATFALVVWCVVRLEQGDARDAADGYARVAERFRFLDGPDSWEAWRYEGERGVALLQAGEPARHALEDAWRGLAQSVGADSPHATRLAEVLTGLDEIQADAEAHELWRVRATGVDPNATPAGS